MKIALIGHGGTGKTTYGPIIAKHWNLEWFDSDSEIEKEVGESIVEIFFHYGEKEFRRMEREVITKLILKDNIVLSTGGGSIVNDETRSDLKNFDKVIWLKASAETIWERIKNTSRPSVSFGIEKVKNILCQREPLYREIATMEVDTEFEIDMSKW